jgi:hypothetical protein
MFSSNGGPGLDLRAIDLQTERDFGIGTYCDALYYFNITDGECIKRFNDFDPFISDSVRIFNIYHQFSMFLNLIYSQNLAFLKYAYDEPCDVDFGVGGSMHASEDGDLLSEVFDRIIGLQFKNLKCGDPFFYTNALKRGEINMKLFYSQNLIKLFSQTNSTSLTA